MLRTVQIESKTRRGNCEELRLEIPPPCALRRPPPARPRPALPRRPPPPASPRPSSQCLSPACATGRRGRGRAAGRRGGAQVRRRRRSLAGRAAFIISRKVYFIFTSPRRGSESNKRLLVSLLFTPRGAHARPANTRVRCGAVRWGGARPGSGRGQRLEERRADPTLHPQGHLGVGREGGRREEGVLGGQGAPATHPGWRSRCKGCSDPLFSG